VSDRPSVCDQIEADLLASAIGEADAATTRHVGAHLDRCGSCRDEFRQYRVIDGAVVGLRSQSPPAGAVAIARERLEARLLDLRSRLLAYRIFPSPFGDILIARSEQGIVLIEYLERASLGASRLSRVGGVEAVEDGEEVEALYRELRDYIEGRTTRLQWPVDLRFVRSDFHRTVLQATAAIPYGAVISYSGLAREVGRPRAVRAVAQALRWNPLPIIVPCHRVIGASGALTGYAGGETTRKQKLLTVEGVPVIKARRDFEIARDAMYIRLPDDTEYCLPSCSSVVRLSGTHAGCLLFGSRERAEAAGLAPCTICRPDLHPLPLRRGAMPPSDGPRGRAPGFSRSE